jgi:hypothetical protein
MALRRLFPRAWAAAARLLARETRSTEPVTGLERRERRYRGRRIESSTWKDGRREGPYAAWWPDGTRRARGQHAAGRRDGEWFFAHPDGTLDRERTGLYRDGRRIAGIRGFNEWLGSP